MKNFTVLVATNHLDTLGGTETYTYAIIEELKRRNLNVEYFTLKKGLVSERIEKNLGVQYMSRKKYDLILANHVTCVEKLYLKGLIIQTCHGIYPQLEQPSNKADYHISISKEVQSHLEVLGFKSDIIHNGINCDRFFPKKNLHKNLTTVLSLCQSSFANDLIRGICEKNNLNFIGINKFVDSIWNIDDEINKADLVVGLGRSAYEAMACGRPIVIYDNRPYSKALSDGYLEPDKVEQCIQNNCSGRKFSFQLKAEDLEKEILKYKIEDGQYLRNYALKNLNIKLKVQEYLDFYFKISIFLKTKLFMKKALKRTLS